jgi:tRNA dimethylallyltransferase
LHRRLAAVDPAAAAKLHPNDVRRLIRALEVFHHTGRLISEQQRQFNEPPIGEPAKVFVLDWPREKLHQRIEKRVDAMFAAGLVDEVRALISIGHGRSLSRTAGQAVGYREILAHLAGDTNLATTVDLVKLHTRQFAKRQLTWFRSLHECRWIPMAEPLLPGQVAAKIASSAV